MLSLVLSKILKTRYLEFKVSLFHHVIYHLFFFHHFLYIKCIGIKTSSYLVLYLSSVILPMRLILSYQFHLESLFTTIPFLDFIPSHSTHRSSPFSFPLFPFLPRTYHGPYKLLVGPPPRHTDSVSLTPSPLQGLDLTPHEWTTLF